VPRYDFDLSLTRRVNRILAAKNAEFYICELSIIEMSSTLAKQFRKHGLQISEFHDRRAMFEDDIGNGLLKVQKVYQSDLLSARDLLEDSAVLNKRDLRSADAIIASCCRHLAHCCRSRGNVFFWTRAG
jgi:predicted nucleic acid-binding protein